MKKRAFLIHGWSGNPSKDWMPWVKSQLEHKEYEVFLPLMPDTDNPKIKLWVNKLKELVGRPRESDIFIGHSVGGQVILRFLEQMEDAIVVGKIILVAPWLKLANLENDEAWKIADPWLTIPINFSKVKPKAKLFVAIFSDNDNWVPLNENKALFQEKLNPRIIVLNNRGHFSEEEGVKEIPEILELL